MELWRLFWQVFFSGAVHLNHKKSQFLIPHKDQESLENLTHQNLVL